jgi:hypothetical protein
MAQQTVYQGNRYDFTTLTIDGETTTQFGGVPFQFPKGVVQSLNWDWQQDGSNVQGNQIQIVGRTPGYGTASGSLELLASEADDWVSTITGNGAVPLGSVYFNLRIAYSVNGTDVRIDTLLGCRIIKGGNNNQKGNDATAKSYDLNISQPFQNGVACYADPAIA